MKDATKAAMKAALADMGITLDKFKELKLSVKQMSEIEVDGVVIRKESTTTVMIEE